MSAILEIVRPLLRYWAVLLIGILFGLLWAWQISPVVWTDAGPVHLSDSYKAEWLKLAALHYDALGDVEQAQRLLIAAGDVGDLLARLINENATSDPVLARQLTVLQEQVYRNIEADALSVQSAADGRSGPGIPALVIVVLIILILWAVAAVARSMPLAGVLRGVLFMRGGGEAQTRGGPTSAQRLAGIREAQRMAETEALDYSESELGPPLAQFMSTYLVGDDFYDDSFSIETGSGEFLGETGAGISETIGVGDPKKVTAVEVWLFDKNDIRTITKVLMSDFAYHDENLTARMAAKGDAVLLEPGGVVTLETNALLVQARVVDLAYGQADPMPPSSYLERLTLELVVWAKQSAPAEASQDIYDDTIPFD